MLTNSLALSSRLRSLELVSISLQYFDPAWHGNVGYPLGRDAFFLYTSLVKETYPNHCPGESNVNLCSGPRPR